MACGLLMMFKNPQLIINILQMQAYKPYVDYLTAGGVTETVYILTHAGAICGTNLPIQQLPSYNFQLEDEKDPNIKHNVVVDERANLLEALANNGVSKNKAGIRLYNQKYYTVRTDPERQILYLKKESGGACIAKTKTFVLIGTFNSTQKMQNGVHQNPGEVNKRVETLAADLTKKGY